MTREEFEELVQEGILAIPEQFRKKMNNVALLLDDEPSAVIRRKQGLRPNETLFGLYHGIPPTRRGAGYGIGGTLPDTITIFQKPIEHAAHGDPERIRRMVRDTVWHEIAHHFGMNEAEVRGCEVRRKRKR